jgi:hypothetical protein
MDAIATKQVARLLVLTFFVCVVCKADERPTWALHITEKGTVLKPVKRFSIGKTKKGSEFVQSLVRKHGQHLDRLAVQNAYGPDSRYLEIEIQTPTLKWVIRSWHPLIETNDELVVTSSGIEVLAGRQKVDVLKKQPQSFQQFRSLFDQIFGEVSKFEGNIVKAEASVNPKSRTGDN